MKHAEDNGLLGDLTWIEAPDVEDRLASIDRSRLPDFTFEAMPVRLVEKIDGDTSIRLVSWGPPMPRTRLGRLALKLRVMWSRRGDAWAVLRGRADVDYGDDW